MKTKTIKILSINTFAHFCVDFSCFYILFSRFAQIQGELFALALLIYNVIAFGLQPIMGYICDKHRVFPAAAVGCGLVLAAVITPLAWSSMIVCALGNACFHVGGGTDTLVYSKGRMADNGIFVALGALGVAFGTIWGMEGLTQWLPAAAAVAAIVLLALFTSRSAGACSFTGICSQRSFWPVIILLCASVAIRAFAGNLLPQEWKTEGIGTAQTLYWPVLLTAFSACAGKASGGILADRLGARRVGIASLLFSLVFLCVGAHLAVMTALGVILFNMTMPITLCAVSQKMPDSPGLAFGLTTLALLFGSIPMFFISLPAGKGRMFALIILVLISALCLYFATTGRQKEK